MHPDLTVLIPAHDEAGQIGPCLEAVLASDWDGPLRIVVSANACRDATVARARAFEGAAEARGWTLTVLDRREAGKTGALNAAEAILPPGGVRVYLDADVTVSPRLLGGLARVLDRPQAAYASGQVRITGRGAVARAYARLWARVPFMAAGVPGCGLFAVNAAGRARWGAFPPVTSDDGFVRLHFAPQERLLVAEPYDWPVAEGLSALIRVRRRQDRGMRELARDYPDLMANEDKAPLGAGGLARLALRDPAGFAVYAGVALGVRARPAGQDWSRGR